LTVEIVEIIGRSEQGVTKPFICRADDDQVYFVKGRGAGMRGLICEWVAGQLGQRLGLPIAPFEIVDVPQELLSIAMRHDLAELGAGKAFGSRKMPVVELSVSHIDYVPEETQRDVLAFDWWVRNGDRSLGETGGNPNLFWDVENEGLVVIDHNQAFDPVFSPQDFADLHAFRGECHVLFGDWVLQQHYVERFLGALSDWGVICNTVPPEWWFVDAEQTVPTDFDAQAAHQLLMRCQTNGFWSLK
jgi:hypothetical protein